MTSLSVKARIAFGLVGLTSSVLLLAAMLDLVPDRVGAVRDGRAALAEVLASSSSGWVDAKDLDRAEETLRLAVDRSNDLLSAAMRRADERIVLRVGEHDDHWKPMQGLHSNDTQIRVPILSSEFRWGELELRFRPLTGHGVMAFLKHPLLLLNAFVAATCFFAFYFYLSKSLTQLDPSKAVPGRVRSALDAMAEGLLVIDRSARVVLANRAFAALVGTGADALIGAEPAELGFEWGDGDDSGATGAPWIRALESGSEEHDVPMKLRDGDGQLRTLMVNCSPVLGVSGQVGGVLVSFDDITELEARGEQLRDAKEQADAANRAKSDFLANMSHEIRTPMNAILGFTEVLRRGYEKDDRRSREYLRTIHSSGTHLLDLINDILDLSKVESGRLDLEQAQVAPHRVIHDVVKVLRNKATEKGVELTFSADGPIPESVLTDPARLRQILTNLVGNAIKFTDAGEVRIVAALDDSGDAPALEIRVSDSGIGIAPDKLETVFEAFAQADSSVTRRFGGTGLGLPISRRFARAMDGDITVSSIPGEGSTFTLRMATGALDGVAMLDPSSVGQVEDEVQDPGNRTWSFSAARVLVVDDAPENRALLSVVLEGTGLEIVEAENGQEALNRVAEAPIDLVLMDMQMPVMDGYTATRELRKLGFTAPIIALTAHAMKGYELECRAAGCDDFVTKPIDIDRIMESLAQWLPGQASLVPSASTTPAPAQPPAQVAAAAAGTDSQPLVSSLAGNPSMARVLGMFADRLKTQLPMMRETCSAGDTAALADLAHWLKGSAGTVGFGDFTDPARRLEEQAREGDLAGAGRTLEIVEALAARVYGPVQDEAAVAPQPSPETSEDRPASPRNGDDPDADDAAPLISALAGDPRMRPVIRMFNDSLCQRLRGASAAPRLDELADLAHWLKGSAGTVGYAAFSEPAQDLEQRALAGDSEGASRALAAVQRLAARVQVPSGPGPVNAGTAGG